MWKRASRHFCEFGGRLGAVARTDGKEGSAEEGSAFGMSAADWVRFAGIEGVEAEATTLRLAACKGALTFFA